MYYAARKVEHEPLTAELTADDVFATYFIPRKKQINVSCEYDRLNGWNSTLQAAWYIRHVRWACLFYASFLIWCL